MTAPVHLVFATAAITLSSFTLPAQAQWTLLSPTISPAQRTEVVMASDGTGALMYAGIVPNNIYIGDIWRFDGTNWTDLKPTGTLPPLRGRFAGDWDEVRRRLVVYGGQNAGGTLGDTWEYDPVANTWSNPTPATTPGPRIHARMAYEIRGLRMILFGGARSAETWSWDGKVWTNLTATTTQSPSGRDQVNMATNTKTGEIVLFGGTTNGGNTGIIGDTWIWNGKDWRQVMTNTVPGGTGIRNGKLTYDEVRDRIVLFGGYAGVGGFTSSAWDFDGTDWTERKAPATLAPRAGMGFVHVRGLKTNVMFSGFPYPTQNETWTFQTDKVASYTAGPGGCAGTNGTPALTGTAPWLGDTMRLSASGVPASGPTFVFFGLSNTRTTAGATLPLALGFMGAPGCSLRVDPLIQFPMATTAGVATLDIPLPNLAGLAGATFYNQVYAGDPGANAAGLVVSNGAAGTIGVR